MVNPRITVPCKHCGEKTTIHVKSIEKLEEENANLRAKVASLEMMRATQNTDPFSVGDKGFQDIFGDLLNKK